ncbi:hypothetical protein SAMN05518871_104274 [Psychrobacillus sp. OK028]|uniref:hypothetical protein n=1 Tax=Psychrobacillus sp. OK028 TaxID=1884359 RepID=UPI000889CD16|nr:hypothetical protein [Psychrobacillus sp. OK028]SDN32914.1 hypothetical protein SAMN05518871_104274 [Psychrobacillus sp. OK028]
MKKIIEIIGIIFIGLSIVIAYFNLENFPENILTYILIILLVSYPLYLLGHRLRKTLIIFKERVLKWSIAYVFVAMFIPLLFIAYTNYEEIKSATFNDHFILFESSSSVNGEGISLGFMLALILFVWIRIFSTDIRRKWIPNLLILVSLIAFCTSLYVLWEDYRGIDADRGLITNKWNAVEESIPWENVTRIYIDPYVHYARLSNKNDETHIAWTMVIESDSNEDVLYRFQNLYEHDLHVGNQVKEIAQDNNIPFLITNMTEDERKWYEFELELENLPKEPFHEFFQFK